MNQTFLSLISGSFIGASLGLLGGGGSILTVPILVYLIGQDVHSATGTSLGIVGSTSLLGAFIHSRRGDVRIKSALAFGLMSVVGTMPGVWLNRLVSGRAILLLFGLLMIGVGIDMLSKKIVRRKEDGVTRPCEAYSPKDWFWLLTLGAGVGFLTGFFGVGGGFLIVPALVIGGNFSTHAAVGTSLVIIAIASATGFLAHLHFGTVNFRIMGLFILGGGAGALIGSALASKMAERVLAKAFGWFIIIMGLYLTYENWLR